MFVAQGEALGYKRTQVIRAMHEIFLAMNKLGAKDASYDHVSHIACLLVYENYQKR